MLPEARSQRECDRGHEKSPTIPNNGSTIRNFRATSIRSVLRATFAAAARLSGYRRDVLLDFRRNQRTLREVAYPRPYNSL